MFVEKFQILLGEQMHVGGIFCLNKYTREHAY
jgi:hypothetical protein